MPNITETVPVKTRVVAKAEGPAPDRHDPEDTSDLTAAPQTDLIFNADPDWVYQWVRRPVEGAEGRLATYLRKGAVGDKAIGFKNRPAWEIVHDDGPELLGRSRADQGSPIDSALCHGNMIAIRLRRDTWNKTYGWEQNARAKFREKMLNKGEKAGNQYASVRAASRDGEVLPEFMGRT